MRVLANRQRLQQVLLNLVGNALKFTDQGSVTVRVEPENGVVCFRVRDTGRGIAPERQQFLFEKFVQKEWTHPEAHRPAQLTRAGAFSEGCAAR